MADSVQRTGREMSGQSCIPAGHPRRGGRRRRVGRIWQLPDHICAHRWGADDDDQLAFRRGRTPVPNRSDYAAARLVHSTLHSEPYYCRVCFFSVEVF
ncbi:MAG: hypothetical protein PUP93_21585 [Rhizonema sp. NSF051]|nr:hypothetical protein [Rhizonema sp. NSF051]